MRSYGRSGETRIKPLPRKTQVLVARPARPFAVPDKRPAAVLLVAFYWAWCTCYAKMEVKSGKTWNIPFCVAQPPLEF
jgi:hypothetical protein